MNKEKEIQKLRARLLALGQPIIIPAEEQRQPEGGSDSPARDITMRPVVISKE